MLELQRIILLASKNDFYRHILKVLLVKADLCIFALLKASYEPPTPSIHDLQVEKIKMSSKITVLFNLSVLLHELPLVTYNQWGPNFM